MGSNPTLSATRRLPDWSFLRMWFDNVGTFMEFGYQHILPQGMDHVLFVVAL